MPGGPAPSICSGPLMSYTSRHNRLVRSCDAWSLSVYDVIGDDAPLICTGGWPVLNCLCQMLAGLPAAVTNASAPVRIKVRLAELIVPSVSKMFSAGTKNVRPRTRRPSTTRSVFQVMQ